MGEKILFHLHLCMESRKYQVEYCEYFWNTGALKDVYVFALYLFCKIKFYSLGWEFDENFNYCCVKLTTLLFK